MNLKVKEAARLLNISEKTLYRWINDLKLPCLRIQGQYRFNRAEILEWASSRRIPLNPEILKEPESGNAHMPSLFEALTEGGIHYRVEGTDKFSAIRSAIKLLPLPPEVNREELLQMIMARESLGSTGIGHGFAIPHVRNPIVLHINNPLVSLCLLENKIDFDAIDGKPVHSLFIIISPTIRAHLKLISRLSAALNFDNFRNSILNRATREEIMNALRNFENTLPNPNKEGSKDK